MPSRVTLHPPVACSPGHDSPHRVRPRVDVTGQPDDVNQMLHFAHRRNMIARIILFDLDALTLAQEPDRPIDVDDVEARTSVHEADVISVVGMINSQLLIGNDGPSNVVSCHVPHFRQPQNVLKRFLEGSIALRELDQLLELSNLTSHSCEGAVGHSGECRQLLLLRRCPRAFSGSARPTPLFSRRCPQRGGFQACSRPSPELSRRQTVPRARVRFQEGVCPPAAPREPVTEMAALPVSSASEESVTFRSGSMAWPEIIGTRIRISSVYAPDRPCIKRACPDLFVSSWQASSASGRSCSSSSLRPSTRLSSRNVSSRPYCTRCPAEKKRAIEGYRDGVLVVEDGWRTGELENTYPLTCQR